MIREAKPCSLESSLDGRATGGIHSDRAPVLGLLLTVVLSCGCVSAPAKHDSLQADLELLGKLQRVDVQAVAASIDELVKRSPAPQTNEVKKKLEQALHLDDKVFATLWTAVEAEAGQPTKDGYLLSLAAAIRHELTLLNDDNQLYWEASNHPAECVVDPGNCQQCAAAKQARNELLGRYVVRIQDYHESNYADVFNNTARWGTILDVGTTVASALATAFVPLSTKTALSASAAIFSGSRLAASRNILSDKSSASVLNAMIKERADQLAILYRGMAQDVKTYSMEQGVVDLATYFNTGGLYKALAEIDAETGSAKGSALANLSDAQNAATLGGIFSASGMFKEEGQIGTLKFEGESLGKLSVLDVRAGSGIIPKDNYELDGLDGSKAATITFTQGHAPAKDTKIEIIGRCSSPGSHSGTIEFEKPK